MAVSQKLFGAIGEQYVAAHLVRHGFTILAQNYQIKAGEIDLIAVKGDILAFVEVKTRTYHLVEPAALVPVTKQRKIIKTAYSFIAQHDLIDKVYRFDIAFIERSHGTLKLEYVENAFTDQQG